MGRRTSQVGSVGRFYLFVPGGKNDAQKYPKKIRIAEHVVKNILIYFQKFSLKILRFLSKDSWFYKILAKF